MMRMKNDGLSKAKVVEWWEERGKMNGEKGKQCCTLRGW